MCKLIEKSNIFRTTAPMGMEYGLSDCIATFKHKRSI